MHLLADETGLPVAFRITAGQVAEYAQAVSLLEGQRAEAVVADKGYDSGEIVATIQALGATAVIPPRRHWKQPRSYDRTLYKQEPHRALLQPPQAVPPLQHALLQNHRSLPILHRARLRMDQTSAICGYCLAHGNDQRSEEVGDDTASGFRVQFCKSELAGTVDGHEEIELALLGAPFCDVDVEVADRVLFELFPGRLVTLHFGQAADAVALEAAMQVTSRRGVVEDVPSSGSSLPNVNVSLLDRLIRRQILNKSRNNSSRTCSREHIRLG